MSGAQSLGTVRMPYDGADPWPRAALEIGGALLLTAVRAARLLAARRRARGYPFLALDRAARARRLAGRLARRHAAAAARRGDRGAHRLLPVARAAAAAAGARRRRAARRGAGGRAAAGRGRRPRRAVVRLQGVRRGARARRPGPLLLEPGLRPDRLAARRQRGHARHLRRAALLEGGQPLDASTGPAGTTQAPDRGGDDFEDELREDWRNKPGWQDRIEVSIRRMRTLDVPGAGHDHGGRERDAAAAAVRRARPLDGELGAAPRRLLHGRGLRPRADGRRAAPGRPDGLPRRARGPARDHPAVPAGAAADDPVGRRRRPTGGSTSAVIHFRPFGDEDVGYVTYPQVRRTRYDAIDSTFRRSPYARTWELAKQFRATAETPFEYILLVNSYLQRRRVRLLRAAAAAAGPAARRSTRS